MSQFGLEQLILEPIHINGVRSFCIDLESIESGVQSSLHQNCHHQIVFSRFDPRAVYSPRYDLEVLHFQKANVDHIRKAINGFHWEKSF